jgi:F-type H+-transporting ATPase subunit b
MRPGWLLTGVLFVLFAVFGAAPLRAQHDKPKEQEAVEPTEGLTTGHSHGEGIFKGAIDLAIWTIVVFLILFFVLAKFAWKPLLAGLEKREENIHQAMEDAKQAKEEAAKLRADFERQIAEVNQKSASLMEETRKHAAELREEMVSQAKAEIQTERDRLHREIDTAKEQALLELWQRSTQLASLLSSKAIRRQLTIEDQHRLVEEALADLGVAASDRQRVLASVQ